MKIPLDLLDHEPRLDEDFFVVYPEDLKELLTELLPLSRLVYQRLWNTDADITSTSSTLYAALLTLQYLLDSPAPEIEPEARETLSQLATTIVKSYESDKRRMTRLLPGVRQAQAVQESLKGTP